ncbi:3-beta hydroxysteroid dehydrogenase [Neosynechococcus sphagnicola sy1]|uniref:3-beta hydroxysteroid dehydrogenase n=1 Tax=Neosynechococcus sphagnicola sy1 TaxID=1497020 RepID=A0A098THF3_9CYAN|nr:NAD-dependent epimerase/dehydratase family protein [Neosynechococcus sphagnicola]KGF72010.1 3-beta hydroxysteroid dehydrogenase [Neosynechococcus sphagnicola sy1]
MPEQVLILGGAGFIGSSLAIGLKARHPDWKILCLDNLRRRGSELNLSRFKVAGIEFIHGDIRSLSDLDPTVLQVDTILDCSAEPSVLAGFSSPQYVLQTNLVGTMNILELARQVRARLLFLSTSRVYPIAPLTTLKLVEESTRFALAAEQSVSGISSAGVSEAFPLAGHRSLYGATKLASELLIEEYRAAYDMPAIVNRCGVITGPWQMGKVDQGVFVLWMAAHFFKKSLSYIGFGGTGKQVRDLLHVNDLLRLIDYQLLNFADLDGSVLNVGGGIQGSLSLLETTQLCQKITGNTIPIRPELTERVGDVPLFITDAAQVIAKTGWQPEMTPERTLQDIYDWISEHENALRPVLS